MRAYPRLLTILALTSAALMTASCREDQSSPEPPPTAEGEGPPRPFEMGISLLPPTLDEAGYARTFDLAALAGEVVLIKRTPPWDEFVPGGQITEKTASITEQERDLVRDQGLKLFFAIDPTDPADRRRLAGLPEDLRGAGFANPDVQRALEAYAEYVVKNYSPDYLAIATDVNLYAAAHREDFAVFVALYAEIYDRLKDLSPDTMIFVTFQYEDLAGVLPTVQEHDPSWEIVEEFGDRLDLLAISTYPSLAFESVKAIPAGYYSQALDHTTAPLAIAETGYSSGPGRRGLNAGTEPLQEEFARFILLNAQALDAQFVIWLAGWDLAYATQPPLDVFRYVGLRRDDDSAKPAWKVWEQAVKRPLDESEASR